MLVLLSEIDERSSAAYFPSGLSVTPFDPIVHETFAIIARRGTRLSPVAEAFAAGIRTHMLGADLGLEAI